jgi:hypothetical protein
MSNNDYPPDFLPRWLYFLLRFVALINVSFAFAQRYGRQLDNGDLHIPAADAQGRQAASLSRR